MSATSFPGSSLLNKREEPGNEVGMSVACLIADVTLFPPQSLLKYLQITYMKFPE